MKQSVNQLNRHLVNRLTKFLLIFQANQVIIRITLELVMSRTAMQTLYAMCSFDSF